MADFSGPTTTTQYATLLDALKARDVDAATLCYSAPTNPPTGMIAWVRASDKIQEWNGAIWVDKVLAVLSGGTGVTTYVALKSAMSFGTMADQNSNAVNITGGSITGISSLEVSANLIADSKIEAKSTAVDSIKTAGGITAAGIGIISTAGKIPAISVTYFGSVSGANLTSIPNSATTATSANTPSAIVARDGSGNFTAGTITATLAGNASTASTASACPWTGITGKPTLIENPFTASLIPSVNGTLDVGSPTKHLATIYVNTIYCTPDDTTGSDLPVVYSVGNEHFYKKTNGVDKDETAYGPGFIITHIIIQKGIVTHLDLQET